MSEWAVIEGDCRERLREMADGSVQTCITSPPYFGLRDYQTASWEGGDSECDHLAGPLASPKSTLGMAKGKGSHDAAMRYATGTGVPFRDVCGKCGATRIDRQIGLEASLDQYVAELVAVFREVRRVLHDTGTLWLNLGDSYAGGRIGRADDVSLNAWREDSGYKPNARSHAVKTTGTTRQRDLPPGYKPKDLLGVPWRVAFALQADGWYLRSDIVWAKPNPMPESVRDRPTKSHEYLFLLTKQPKYFYDSDAIREPLQTPVEMRGKAGWGTSSKDHHLTSQSTIRDGNGRCGEHPSGRNKRTVWTITPKPFSGAKLLADYVGADGKFYTASPDCPHHGYLARSGSARTGECDARLDYPASRIPGSDGRLGQVLHGEPAATASSSNGATGEANSHEHTSRSTGDCRTPNQCESSAHGQHGDGESLPRTGHTTALSTLPADTSDSLRCECAPTAMPHSTQTRRTDLDPATTQPCTPCAQTPGRTDGTLALPGFDEPRPSTTGSNTGASDSGGYRSERKLIRNVDTSSPYCNCTMVSVDHFAVMPPALVEPCILAGTSERGQCPECGAPWRRVTTEASDDRKPYATEGMGSYANGAGRNDGKGLHKVLREDGRGGDLATKQRRTIGFEPSCSCDAGEPVPQLVLDPFNGAGTVGVVALTHGRRYVGIELNPEYAAMARERIAREARPRLLAG